MKSGSTLVVAVPRHMVWWAVVLLLAVMPFHAFLVIVLGKFIGHQAIWQGWKELLSIAIVGLSVYIFARSQPKERLFRLDTSNVLALAFVALGLVITVALGVAFVPAVFGIKVVLLPFILFLAIQLAGVQVNDELLTKLVLWPSYMVATVAILQEYFIPQSWWGILGYSDTTIRPIQLVDPAVRSIRAFATLGGPNQLGAYLILPTILGLVLAVRTKRWQYALGAILTGAGSVVSFSRSAWLGMMVALVCAVFLLGNKMLKIILATLVGLGLVSLLLLSSSLPQYLKGTKAQYFLLHGRYNDTSQVEGSDVGRTSSQRKAIAVIAREPWGHGLGTAGPASFRASQPFITESWYLQIGLELGLVGLALFIVFCGNNVVELVRLNSPLSLALAASIMGLSLTNLFLHAWADSTLGIMTFSLLGLMRNKRV